MEQEENGNSKYFTGDSILRDQGSLRIVILHVREQSSEARSKYFLKQIDKARELS